MAFKKGMIFGVASASYQIEGAYMEQGKGLSIWDVCSHHPGNVRFGHTGDVACDHFHRYSEDIAIMKDLGLDAYRMSVSWPRIMPDCSGSVNEKGLDFYDRLTDELLKNSITPFITLFHWDLPYEIYKQGGWLNRDIARRFAEYTYAVVRRLSDRVKHWITLNEPQCFIGLGYQSGVHAPFLRCSQRDVLTAAHNAMLAHGEAVGAIRAASVQPSLVGFAPTGSGKTPATDNPVDIEAAKTEMYRTNHNESIFSAAWWSDPIVFGKYPEDGLKFYDDIMPDIKDGDMEIISSPIDFYGMNVYHSERIRMGSEGKPEVVPFAPGFPRTSNEWPVTPEALYWNPKFIYERYKLPIYITENGMAGCDWIMEDGKVHDPQRVDFLSRYLKELERAANDGVDIAGYFVWTLLDNYEWAEGYEKRFGIVHMDFETQIRTLKDSALWYKKYIADQRWGI